MGFFKFLGGSPEGRPSQDGPPQLSETEKKRRLGEIRSKIRQGQVQNDFSRISLDDLNFVFEHDNLDDSIKKLLLEIAKRPEVAPSDVSLQRSSLIPLPSPEVLRHELVPLSEVEVKKRLQEFVADILSGNITLLMKGNNAHVNQSFTKAQECGIPSVGLLHNDPNAEAPIYLDKLASGYKRTRSLLSDLDWKALTSYATFCPYVSDNGFACHANQRDRNEQKKFDDANTSGSGTRMTRAYGHGEGYYYQEGKIMNLHLKASGRKSSVRVENNRVKKEETIQTFPAPIVNILMSLDKPSKIELRPGYFVCTLLFIENAGVNSARAVLNDTKEDKRENSLYAYYMHALASNPGFFLEGLRAAVPEALQAPNKSKQYYGKKTESVVEVDTNFPELQMIGNPKKMQFKQIAS